MTPTLTLIVAIVGAAGSFSLVLALIAQRKKDVKDAHERETKDRAQIEELQKDFSELDRRVATLEVRVQDNAVINEGYRKDIGYIKAAIDEIKVEVKKLLDRRRRSDAGS